MVSGNTANAKKEVASRQLAEPLGRNLTHQVTIYYTIIYLTTLTALVVPSV